MAHPRPTVTLLIIGDEILSGKVVDENGPFLLRRLRSLGAEVRRVHVIPDELDIIASYVAEASAASDWVLTSGGVGPTHDDLTMEGVARGLGRELAPDPLLVELIEKWVKDPSEATRRMALVPAGADVQLRPGSRFPQVQAGNVLIFPGVPGLLRRKFEAVSHLLAGEPVACAAILTRQPEGELASALDAALERCPGLSIGSYPLWEGEQRRVRLILEHASRAALEQALVGLKASLDEGAIEHIDLDYQPAPVP